MTTWGHACFHSSPTQCANVVCADARADNWLYPGFALLWTASDAPGKDPASGSLFLCPACPMGVWEGSEAGSARDTGLDMLLCLHR